MSKKNDKMNFGGKFTVVKNHEACYKFKDSDGNTWCSVTPLIETAEVYITKVVYNNPATIVFWNDGTKTVAKSHGEDSYLPEVGLMICCFKKLTSGSALKNLLTDWTPSIDEYRYPETNTIVKTISDVRKMHKENR